MYHRYDAKGVSTIVNTIIIGLRCRMWLIRTYSIVYMTVENSIILRNMMCCAVCARTVTRRLKDNFYRQSKPQPTTHTNIMYDAQIYVQTKCILSKTIVVEVLIDVLSDQNV